MTRAGRRAGASGTRDAIAAAARELFASVGYRRATIRAVASRAGVDPALVMHFYGSKEGLFRAATALPFDPASMVEELLSVDRAALGGAMEGAGVWAEVDPDARRTRANDEYSAALPPVRIVRRNKLTSFENKPSDWSPAGKIGVQNDTAFSIYSEFCGYRCSHAPRSRRD